MYVYHNRRCSLRKLILYIFAALMVIGAAGCSKTEQEILPVSSRVDSQLPELEITREITQKTEITEEAAAEDVTPEPKTAEVITREAETAEDITPEIEIEEFTEEPDFEPYDISLSPELQRYTFDLCRERGLVFEIVLALMYAESSYRPDLISQTDDYGIMQLNKVNHGWLSAELDITDFLDAGQNIDAGTFLLMGIAEKYPDTHQMLMVYNMGEAGAKKCWNKGIYNSRYSRKIVAMADGLKNNNSLQIP